MSDRNRLLLVGLTFLALGLFNIVDGFLTSYRMIKWSNAQGTVLSSYLQDCSRGKSGRGLSPKISYSYVIDSATYVSYRIAPRDYSDCMIASEAKKVIGKYPEQATVSVYFNHKQPTEAFVFGGRIAHWYNLLLVLGGLVCIFLGLTSNNR
jgi:hypothetical protein